MDVKKRKQTLRMLSNGVYVLTSRSAGQYGAATVTWVAQASSKPPLLMVALRRDSNVFRCLAASGSAALHIVGKGQREMARRFFYPTDAAAGAIHGEPIIESIDIAPVLRNLPDHIQCRVDRIIDTEGDHAVVILAVTGARCRKNVRPLRLADTTWQYGG